MEKQSFGKFNPKEPRQVTAGNQNVKCGSLQCQLGNRYPVVVGMDEYYTRTVITIKGTEYECKATTGLPDHPEISPLGLVNDGTPCGDNLVCVNQTCTSIFPYIDHTKCPIGHNNNECSGKGDAMAQRSDFAGLLWFRNGLTACGHLKLERT
ncbi:hypothetical protein MSG28_003701 [Choristoneura fumiferana]|uniref:Uncharacterized protein n=1 Tax=Choristoneura fumiferana TaxID=7141 RepID=A0ACC0KGH6_CHOFU|nr:hypothetical protein MSG28_003701 [Choristoneura fumiferana]